MILLSFLYPLVALFCITIYVLNRDEEADIY